jgi:hypothetical protein
LPFESKDLFWLQYRAALFFQCLDWVTFPLGPDGIAGAGGASRRKQKGAVERLALVGNLLADEIVDTKKRNVPMIAELQQ